jgi:transketolase
MSSTSNPATAPPLPPPRDPKLRHMANALRALAMDAVEQAKSGHPGMPRGSAPGEALYAHFGITPERVAEAARSLL